MSGVSYWQRGFDDAKVGLSPDVALKDGWNGYMNGYNAGRGNIPLPDFLPQFAYADDEDDEEDFFCECCGRPY